MSRLCPRQAWLLIYTRAINSGAVATPCPRSFTMFDAGRWREEHYMKILESVSSKERIEPRTADSTIGISRASSEYLSSLWVSMFRWRA